MRQTIRVRQQTTHGDPAAQIGAQHGLVIVRDEDGSIDVRVNPPLAPEAERSLLIRQVERVPESAR